MLKILMMGAVALLVLACGGAVSDADAPDCASASCDLVSVATNLPLPSPPIRYSCAISPPECRSACEAKPFRQLCANP
jgi:hypothetical protein